MALEGYCASSPETKNQAREADSANVLDSCLQVLDALIRERDSLNNATPQPTPNAYYYQVLTQPALYSSPLHQMLSLTDSPGGDPQLVRLRQARRMLASLYTEAPQLVKQTEDDIKGQAAIRNDVMGKIQATDKLADKVAAATLAPETDGNIYFGSDVPLEIGTFADVRILGAKAYDLMGVRV